MPLDHCLPTLPTILVRKSAAARVLLPARTRVDSWRYDCPRRSRAHLAVGVALSAALHIGVIWGPSRRPHAVPAKAVDPIPIAVALEMPKLKDLEEPEPVPVENTEVVLNAGIMMPSQPDLPQLAVASDFVQRIDLSSLTSDLSQVKLATIPEHILRGGGGGPGTRVFNLAELDRAPEPLYQPSPVFPHQLKREVSLAHVVVIFIIDASGLVQRAAVLESTHAGFDDAALTAVSKWKFRPGMKDGQKVGARMQVPIVFRVVGDR